MVKVRLVTLALLFVVLSIILTIIVMAFESEMSVIAGKYPMQGSYHAQLINISFLNRDPVVTRAYDLLRKYKTREAIEYLKKEIPLLKEKVKRGKGDPKVLSDLYAFLAYAYLIDGKPKEAIEYANKSVIYNKGNYLAYYFRASAYYLLGDIKATQRDLETCVIYAPFFIPAKRVLAQNYLDMGQYSKAIDYYRDIVELIPESGYFNYQLYKAYMKAGKFEDAERVLRKLIQIEPNFRLNYYRLAEVLRLQKKYKEAEKEYKKILERFKNDRSMLFKAYLGLAKLEYDLKNFKKAKYYLTQALKYKKHDKELEYYLSKVNDELRRERKAFLAKAILVTALIFASTLVLIFLHLYREREVTLSYQREFDKAYEEFFTLYDACKFAVNFFSKITRAVDVALFLYNYQASELYITAYKGKISQDLKEAKIIASDEARRFFLPYISSRNFIIPLILLEKNPAFENAFPTLYQRLKNSGLNYITPLFDRRSLKGIFAFSRKDISFFEKLILNDRLSVLLPRIAVAIESLVLYETSIVDETTGIYNKRYFRSLLTAELKRSIRYNQPCSLIIFDLDDFKKINDNFGHLQGDRTLREIATIVKSCIREGIDIFARIGGEEFALLLPATSTEGAVKVAERIRKAVESHKFPFLPEGYKVTLSLGVATFPYHATDEESFIKVADDALYAAKKMGKNRVVVASPDKNMKDKEAPGRVKSLEEQLQLIDPKTNLPLYNYFILRMRQELKRARRYKIPLSLIAFRVSNLQFTKTQKVREELIKEIASQLKGAIRYGIDIPTYDPQNEAFLLLLPETPKDKAIMVAKRLRKLLAELGSTYFSIVGFPEDATTSEQFLMRALQVLQYANDDAPIQFWQMSVDIDMDAKES